MKRSIVFILLISLLLAAFLPMTALAAETVEVVRVGWFLYPGSAEGTAGNYSGYTYDYLMEIAKYTGWQYEFVEADFAACVEMLIKGEVDIIGGLQKDSQREAVFDYPDTPYGQSYTVLFTADGSPLQPYDFEGFDGILIGYLKDTQTPQHIEKFARESGFAYTLAEYATTGELHAALAAGEIDAALLASYSPGPGTYALARFSPISTYLVTTKGNTAVLSGLNQAINRIKIDRLYFEAELYEKHYAATVSSELTKQEQELIRASQETPVTVGAVDNGAPILYYDETSGQYMGIAIDMLEAVSEKTGLRFSYVPADLSRRDAATVPTETSPSLLLGATRTDSAPVADGWHLSESVYTGALAVAGLKGKNLSEEQGGKTVAVMSGFSSAESFAAAYLPEYRIDYYPTQTDCLDAVAEGKADAAVNLHSCISYLLQKPGYARLDILPTYSEAMDVCVAAFTEENAAYIGIIDKGLLLVSEGERRSITLNHTLGAPYKLTIGDILYKYRATMLVIAGLVVIAFALLTALYLNRRRSGKAVQAALAEARAASAAKGNFMSRMSHEIRTPLNAVIGYNTIARSELTEAKTDEERRQSEMKVMDCLTKSDIASRHLLTIINDVLDMSAIESGKIKVLSERFDFKGLISSLTAVFYSQAKSKGVDFDVRFDSQMDEWVVGDQMRVNQILTNLLSNAVKFTPDGGRVTLYIRPRTETDAVHLQFVVEDTGIGMTQEYMDRIWQPFEQADATISRRFGGTGLGLSITKTLVELLGGSISVESSLGQGSSFTVELTFRRTEQPEDSGPYDFSTINALIVDDDASTCDYIRLLLTRSGVRSSAVHSGPEAIAAVEAALRDREPYTVCLVDWRMPGMDGLETVSRIRGIAGLELPIIVITAYDFTEVADRAASVGVNMFISKPLFQSSLFNLLANISGSPVPKESDKPAAYDFGGARILLAEDNAMNMEIARQILEPANLQVDSAWNGREALDMFLAAPSGTYAAILMDVQMPVLDGYEATRLIRGSEHPDAAVVPIIAMTADAFAENVAESRAAGMNDHISKPIDLPSLFRTLGRFIS